MQYYKDLIAQIWEWVRMDDCKVVFALKIVCIWYMFGFPCKIYNLASYIYIYIYIY